MKEEQGELTSIQYRESASIFHTTYIHQALLLTQNEFFTYVVHITRYHVIIIYLIT